MCKVLVKEVKRAHEPKTGTGSTGKKWTLWLFDCLVDVDNTGKFAQRLVKTFDAQLAEQIKKGAGETFEAKKQGEEAPFSYLVEPKKKAWGSSAGKSDRQVALECAARVVSACGIASEADLLTPGDYVLLEADKMLAWLEG